MQRHRQATGQRQATGRSRRVRRAITTALALPLAVCALGVGASAAAATPAANTGNASNVTFSSAILFGEVNPRGQATTYDFQYGTSTNYSTQTPLAPAGGGNSSIRVSQTITGLQPLTTYHYRIVATASSGGAVTGKDRTFRTGSVPLSVAIAGVPNPVVFGAAFLVEGTLSGTGSANHEVTLQSNPFPYLGGFKPVGNPQLTNGSGGFSFPYLGLLENAQLRVVTVGKPEVSSPVISEGVAVRVSFHARATGRRGFARLYGTVAPAEVGALVGFQMLRPGRSLNVGGTNVKRGTATVSRFSRVVHLPRHGLYRALIKISDGAHVSAYSPSVVIR